LERVKGAKMVRAPCCEKMGLKKGPWTTEEDHILISYIKNYGHENWRALPKQAGNYKIQIDYCYKDYKIIKWTCLRKSRLKGCDCF
jgi:hypothetical protein